jgi:predicted Zn finger-like uncharacterized protein
MILTCPECATGYFVDDGLIRATGRAVRCAACGRRWTAYPPKADEPLELGADTTGAGKEPAPEPEAPAPLTGDDLPRMFRGRAEAERRNRRAALDGVVWTAAALAVLAVIGLAVVFREAVVGMWPQTASLYAGVGLPVNAIGLAIEQTHAEPGLQDGHATLVLSGVIRNVTDHAVVAPPLRISILNAQGKRVAGQIAVLGNSRIPPGESRHFVTAILDPPASYDSASFEFTDKAPAGAVRATTTPMAAPTAPQATSPPAFTLRGAGNALAPAASDTTPTNAAGSTNAAAPR